MPMVQIEAERAGTHWLGKVIGPAGTREFWQRHDLKSDDDLLSFIRQALVEIGTPPAPSPPIVCEPIQPQPQRMPRHARRSPEPPLVVPVEPVPAPAPPIGLPLPPPLGKQGAAKLRAAADAEAEAADPDLAGRRRQMAARKL